MGVSSGGFACICLLLLFDFVCIGVYVWWLMRLGLFVVGMCWSVLGARLWFVVIGFCHGMVVSVNWLNVVT